MSSPQIFPSVDPDIYRQVCSQFATGVAIATVRAADGTPHGLTVSSFTPVSIDPPLILICIDFRCAAVEHFRTGPFFAINILTSTQRDLSIVFAAKPEGRFEGVRWISGLSGAPLLEDTLAVMECRLHRVLDVGDHAVIFGEMVSARLGEGEPLVYFNRTYRALR